MGCSPSRNVGLVTPAGPDTAISAPVTAAGAPITFETTQASVSEEEHFGDKEPGQESFVTEPDYAHSVHDLRRVINEKVRKPGEQADSEDLNPQKDSPNSASSRDSGIEELEEEYSFVITEYSDPNKREEIESNFKGDDSLELLIVGKACSRKLSPKDKERNEEINILNKLREEGFVPRPPSRVGRGLRFEIVPAYSVGDETCPGLRKLPPLSLQKALEKKKTINLTKKDIEEKLEKAEERRKQQEEEKLCKIAVKGRIEALTTLEQQTTDIKEKYHSKMEHNAKVRQDKLRELQTRLKNRREHVEKVRHRKELLESVPNLDQM